MLDYVWLADYLHVSLGSSNVILINLAVLALQIESFTLASLGLGVVD